MIIRLTQELKLSTLRRKYLLEKREGVSPCDKGALGLVGRLQHAQLAYDAPRQTAIKEEIRLSIREVSTQDRTEETRLCLLRCRNFDKLYFVELMLSEQSAGVL